MAEHEFDVAILGSGITGSTLAAILARNGVKTLLVEQAVHPRFAIGESTVPETTFLFRVLAARYGVPELANLSTYSKLRRNVTITCGVKRSFSFAFHREGHAHQPTECSQMPTPSPPLGPDMHMFRQDVDGYLLGVAASYGATVRQQTDVTEVRIDDGVRLKSRTGELFRCAYVIDAGGIKSPLATAYGLREEPCSLRTTSRAVYTHMIGVKPFDAVTASPAVHGLPSALSQGTLHHIFEGGWLWVIPFDNHPASSNRLCSVGLMLDPRVHPATGLPPEQEFRTFIARFPSIAEQFLNAKAMRPWLSAERLQFSSTSLVGERYCLLPHAFAFVDPLFSSGLTVSMAALNMLAWRLIDAKKDENYSVERFRPIEKRVQADIEYFDQLVSTSYVAFQNFKLWNAWHRVWGMGTVYGALAVLDTLGAHASSGDVRCFEACEREPYAGSQASQLPEYRALFDIARGEVARVERGELSAEAAALSITEAVRASGMWPKPWGVPSPALRHPGAFTVAKNRAFVKWMRAESPGSLRQHYFVNFGPKRMLALVWEDFLSEVRSALTSFFRLLRDFRHGYNRDWATPTTQRLESRAASPAAAETFVKAAE
jgi:FADH2 O2-dependent halogenase